MVSSIFTNTLGPLQISYRARGDVLTLVGGNGLAIPGGCFHPPNTFCSFIYDISTASPRSDFLVRNSQNGQGYAQNVTLSSVGAVPEPATWAMMIFGFAAIGGAMRRQRKTNVKVSYA